MVANGAVSGLKMKAAMGLLNVSAGGSVGLSGVGWRSYTRAERVATAGIYGIRCYPAVAMSGSDFVVFVQPYGATSPSIFYVPRVVYKGATYFDIGFMDPTTYLFIDPNDMDDLGTSYWQILALDT
jgi:hypothetical protein